jgi:hypothetical protein
MKYATKKSPGAIKSCFGNLFDTEDAQYKYPVEPWSLKRGTQNKTDNIEVHITQLSQVIHLLDYLSTSHKSWDYEPLVTINIGKAHIQFQRRGNWEHLHLSQLKVGDSLIIDDFVIQAIKDAVEKQRAKWANKEKELDKKALEADDYLPF